MATSSDGSGSETDVTCAHEGCACAVDAAGYCSAFCAEHDAGGQRAASDSWCRCGHTGCYFSQ